MVWLQESLGDTTQPALDREIGCSKRRKNFKVTCSCFLNRKYPFPVATYPNEQAQGSSDICIGQT